MNSNKKKSEQLGMSHGTASHTLRKKILFAFVQETGKDICFQCKKQIETIDDLSIEHKSPWQNSPNPKELFFDLTNIAFSHLFCNIGAGRKPHAYSSEKDRHSARLRAYKKNNKNNRTPETRHAQYLRTGK